MSQKKKNQPNETARSLWPAPSTTDPQGSWTGVPVDESEVPVQDADDL